MKRICIYCGSNNGSAPEYLEYARKLGKYLANQKIEVVYGGAESGVMGAVANGALSEGGKVIGIIPKSINDKVGHKLLTELHIVENMHERKTKMFELSNGFIGLPGGIGTLEEIFEILTWAQLGFHSKPCGILNVKGYFNQLLQFLEHSVNEQFLKEEHKNMLIIENDPEKILQKFKSYKAPNIKKWVENAKSSMPSSPAGVT